MRAYMAYDAIAGSDVCALLVIAHRAHRARLLGFAELCRLLDSAEWKDARAEWIQDAAHLLALADPEKLARGESHIVANPPCCTSCELWGEPLNGDGMCPQCADDAEDWDV